MYKHLISGFLALGLFCGAEAQFLYATDDLQVIEFTYDSGRELPQINLPANAGRSQAPVLTAQNKAGAEGAGDGQMLDTLFSSGELDSKTGPADAGDSSVIYLEKTGAPKKAPAPYAPLPPNVKSKPAEAKTPAPAAPVQAQATPAEIVRKKPAAPKAAVKQTGPRSFCDQYSGSYQKTAFNPRARAVVNPHPSPRPPLAEVYPKTPGRQDADFRLWELAIYNWSRVR